MYTASRNVVTTVEDPAICSDERGNRKKIRTRLDAAFALRRKRLHIAGSFLEILETLLLLSELPSRKRSQCPVLILVSSPQTSSVTPVARKCAAFVRKAAIKSKPGRKTCCLFSPMCRRLADRERPRLNNDYDKQFATTPLLPSATTSSYNTAAASACAHACTCANVMPKRKRGGGEREG